MLRSVHGAKIISGLGARVIPVLGLVLIAGACTFSLDTGSTGSPRQAAELTRTQLAFDATVIAEVTGMYLYDLTLTATSYTPTSTPTSTSTTAPTLTPPNTYTPSLTYTPTSTRTASLTPTVTASPTASPTPSNLSESSTIELLASFAGTCSRTPFDSEVKYLAVLGDSLIDVATGERIFALVAPDTTVQDYRYRPYALPPSAEFTPDGLLLVVYGGTVYRVSSGEEVLQGPEMSSRNGQYILGLETRNYQTIGRIYIVGLQRIVDLPNDFEYVYGTPIGFANDGRLVFESGDIFDPLRPASTGRIAVQEFILTVSPDGTKVVGSQGVYSLATGNLLFSFSEYFDGYGAASDAKFDPSGRYLAVAGLGVFDVESGRRLFGFQNEPLFSSEIEFSHDGALMAYGHQIYNTLSGNIVVQIGQRLNEEGSLLFNGDASLLAVPGSGIIDIEGGQYRFSIVGDSYGFSSDGQVIAVNNGKSCSVYGLPDNSWPIAERLIVLAETGKIRRIPDISGPIVIQAGLALEPIGVSKDGQWFQVEFEGELGYVDRFDVQEVLIPDDYSLPEFDRDTAGD